MALYRIGDVGDPVRDIRTDSTSWASPPLLMPAAISVKGPRLRSVHSRNRIGSPVDGFVGRETWRTMVDAGYRLGDRLLYNRMPMLHGDDVAELQRRLNALGFDTGSVDGIFGASTLRAVLDYQQNREMAEDGVVGPEVVEELALVCGRPRRWVAIMSERTSLALGSPQSLAGLRVFLDPFCRDDHEAAESWTAAGGAALTSREAGAQAFLPVRRHPTGGATAGRTRQ